MKQYVDAAWGWDESWQHQRQKEEFTASTYRIIEAAGQSVGTFIVERRAGLLLFVGVISFAGISRSGNWIASP